MKVYLNGRLAGSWISHDGIEYDFIPFVCGAETGAGYGAAAIGQYETKKANKRIVGATIEAAKIAAKAQVDAQEAALKAQKEATAESIAAAKEAEANANRLIAEANILVEQYTQEGVDFSNTEAARAVSEIQGIFKDVYDKNIGGFQQTYDVIKDQYAKGLVDVEKSFSPWVKTGEKATGQLNALMGFEGEEAAKNALLRDPSYQWREERGRQAIERSAIGDTGLMTGNTAIELQKYGQGMASQEFNNAFNRLMALSTQGQEAASNLASYKWNAVGGNVANEQNLNSAMSASRSIYGDKQAALQDYLSQNRLSNNQRLTGTRTQNALNAANIAMQGSQNVANVTGAGAQNNAGIAIQGAYNTGNALANRAYQIGAAQANYYNAQNQNTVNTLNNIANYTDTMSVNAYNRAADLAGTAASIYGGGR